jgi:HPt (histidine-containing phosphotransfer) domain-containing protein
LNDSNNPSAQVPEILDMRVIESLKELGGEEDPGLVLELVGMFLQDAPLRMREIETSLASGDIGTLERAAHTLKSSSANIGAARFSASCKAMEELARRKSYEGLPSLVTQSLKSWSELETVLRNLRC